MNIVILLRPETTPAKNCNAVQFDDSKCCNCDSLRSSLKPPQLRNGYVDKVNKFYYHLCRQQFQTFPSSFVWGNELRLASDTLRFWICHETSEHRFNQNFSSRTSKFSMTTRVQACSPRQGRDSSPWDELELWPFHQLSLFHARWCLSQIFARTKPFFAKSQIKNEGTLFDIIKL